MKKAKAIVAFINERGVGKKVDVDLVNNLLHERVKALRGAARGEAGMAACVGG